MVVIFVMGEALTKAAYITDGAAVLEGVELLQLIPPVTVI